MVVFGQGAISPGFRNGVPHCAILLEGEIECMPSRFIHHA